MESLKAFVEGLAPYNSVGKLKNLRIGLNEIDAQKRNLSVLGSIEKLQDLVAELGATAGYLAAAELVLLPDHPWIKQAQAARAEILDKLTTDHEAQHALEYRKLLDKLKKDYRTAYIAHHGKARLGVAEDKTKSALRKDARLVAVRALAGISLMPTSQLATFEDKLDKLKSCASLVESDLASNPYCHHCGFRPASEQLEILPAANVLKALDDELDRLLDGWQQTSWRTTSAIRQSVQFRLVAAGGARFDCSIHSREEAARPCSGGICCCDARGAVRSGKD